MPEPVSGVHVVIDEDDDSVRVDPATGTIERDQPDGGVVVSLDAHRPRANAEDENPFAENLADQIDGQRLQQIANDLFDAIQADDRSRQGYLDIRARGYELLGIKLQEPRGTVGATDGAIEGMSSVTNPLLLEAVLKGWANAQAELLPAEGPCKVIVDGEGSAADDELADALERDMNHYLTVTASEYYPDTSHMLLWGVYFGGSGFKKVYRCPMRRRVVSESVDAKDLIVSDTTKDLASCGRITHQISMRPSVMKRMKLVGAYRDTAALTQPNPTTNLVDQTIASIQGTQTKPDRPEDQPYTIWESQCEIDLPDFAPPKFANEGIPLPYIVTMDKDSREILAIRRDWEEDDEDCNRERMWIKYPYVPGPGFYGTGMLNILGNLAAAMTAVDRESLDAGMFASFPGGLIAKGGARQNTSRFAVGPGQFEPIETNGQPIGNIVMGMPYRDVTPGLMAMRDKILAQAKELSGVTDIPSSEGVQNVPVGTMLAQIEQATKVMAAAHKGMHHALAEELQLIVKRMREDPECFWRGNKVAPQGFWDEQKFIQAINDYRLTPASDPNVPSHIHRVAKALGLVSLFNIPQFAARLDADEALRRILAVLKEDPQGLQIPAAPMPQGQPAGPPPPDPLIGQARMLDAQTKARKVQLDAQNDQQQAAMDQEKIQAERDIATVNLSREMVIHNADEERAQREAAIDAERMRRETGLDAAQHLHDVVQGEHQRGLDVAKHGLDVHQALNPPPMAPKSPQE